MQPLVRVRLPPYRRARTEPAEGQHGLADLVVIGAMKAGTTVLHRYLGEHPEIGMAPRKELNFFFGPEPGPQRPKRTAEGAGNWHRGLDWYTRQFPPARLRGEASPGYTSPSFPEVAGRMARIMPGVRIIYSVRDPIQRAISQYRHHRADGTERRPLEDALLDPESQYIARSRFYVRLAPYLDHFHREQILICSQEELLHEPRRALRSLYRFLGVDEAFARDAHRTRSGPREVRPVTLSREGRRRLASALADDCRLLCEFARRDLFGWQL